MLNGIAERRSVTDHADMTDQEPAGTWERGCLGGDVAGGMEPSNGAPAPAFVQVLCIGRAATSALIAALRRQGVVVIVAFDAHRGEQLLTYVRPHAILCAATDAKAVLAYADANIQVIVLGHEQWAGVYPIATVISSALSVADVARRLREDIAANRSGAALSPLTLASGLRQTTPWSASERQPAL